MSASRSSVLELIDQLCDRFEEAWRAGREPHIEEYLAGAPEVDQTGLLRELLALEIDLRAEAGDRSTPEQYKQRFPDAGDLIAAVFAKAADHPVGSEGATTPHKATTGGSEIGSEPPPPSESPPSPEYIGRYKVIRWLGGGTYGDVYLSHDAVMDRQVAVKVPSARLLATERAREEFHREARSVARLQHEGIVRAYDFGQEVDGRCFIVYEYIEGMSLSDRIKPERLAADPLQPDEAARIVAEAAEALHYAHLQEMFHRDVKPANILLDRQGRPRVTDFGLAVREEDLAGQRGILAGTLPYMSPEQVRGEGHHLDGRSDLYSLGVVLYELLCGRRPFTPRTQDDLIDQILHRQARPPRQIRDTIPRELERICLKALSKQINDRYTTGGDMAEELRRALPDRTVGRPQAQRPDGGGVRLPGLTFERICEEPHALVHRYLGPFLVKEFIGSGGTGLVYRASNVHTGREVCVKVLYSIPRSALEPVSKSISRWVRGLAVLDHSNIATPLEFAALDLEDGVSFYVATEFIRGEPLGTWNKKLPEGPAAVAARTRVALDITEALQAAHACTYIDEVGFECRGVLHGDIKPSNVIVRPDGSAVLIDFMMVDVNRLVNPPRTVGHGGIPSDINTDCYGTPGFMAPEQQRDGIVTVRSDILSLGKTFALLFFPDRSPSDPLPPDECDTRLAGLVRLIRPMVESDPSLRPPDMGVVRQLLMEAHDLNVKCPPAGQFSEPGEAKASPYLDQNVQFSVYRPGVVRPRQWYTMLAFAHLSERPPDAEGDEPDPIEEVQRQARQVLGEKLDEYRGATQDSQHPVAREGELKFVPEAPGVEFNPLSRSFVWEEAVHREEFRLRASPELDGQSARGRLTVFLGGIILAEVNLSIPVSSSHRTGSKTEPHEVARARPYRRIFASYSRKDSWVVEQFKKYAGALGDEYVKKHIPLRADEEWSSKLERLIEEADIFQLFWSTNSMHSPFIQREWEHALSLRRPNFIRPCYWERPLPTSPEKSLPPDDLRRIHFQCIPLVTLDEVEAPALDVDEDFDAGDFDDEGLGSTLPSATAAPSAPPLAFGNFVVDAHFGCGGLGMVYRAHHASGTFPPSAIKVLRGEVGDKEKLQGEYDRLSKLQHPGIVRARGFGIQDGAPYLVTDYVEGICLGAWLGKHRPSCHQAALLVASVADALAHAHSRGVVHRDVKPSNIILTGELYPVLLDFGLSIVRHEAGESISEPARATAPVPPDHLGSVGAVADQIESSPLIVGTPAYMPPEQARGDGQHVDGRSDIYSLGVILYEMLCGRRPFPRNDGGWPEFLRRVLEEDPPPPRQLAPKIPRDLEAICLKAMAKTWFQNPGLSECTPKFPRVFGASGPAQRVLKPRLSALPIATLLQRTWPTTSGAGCRARPSLLVRLGDWDAPGAGAGATRCWWGLRRRLRPLWQACSCCDSSSSQLGALMLHISPEPPAAPPAPLSGRSFWASCIGEKKESGHEDQAKTGLVASVDGHVANATRSLCHHASGRPCSWRNAGIMRHGMALGDASADTLAWRKGTGWHTVAE